MKFLKPGRLLLAFTLTLSTLPIVHAEKGGSSGGGGHFVFNPDGSVVIADNYYHNTLIVPTPVSKSIQDRAKTVAKHLYAIGLAQIPIDNLHSYSFVGLFDSALYYFVDILPQVADCGLKVQLNLPSGATADLAACTSKNHTFIKSSDWEAAGADAKALLLVHERLREITGPNTAEVEGKIMTIVQAAQLIEKIHSKEVQNKFEFLSLNENQLLEQSRVAVVDIAFQGHVPERCWDKLSFQTTTCFADTLTYGISRNGGGLIPRVQTSNVPDSTYLGVGSIIISPVHIGENDRLVSSGVFIEGQSYLEDKVSLYGSQVLGTAQNFDFPRTPAINGLRLIVGTSLTNSLIEISPGTKEGQLYDPTLSGTLGGGFCELSMAKNYQVYFSLPSACK